MTKVTIVHQLMQLFLEKFEKGKYVSLSPNNVLYWLSRDRIDIDNIAD